MNVLLEGPTGTGKTFSIGTLVDVSPQLEVFFLGLESGMESLIGYWTDRKLPVPPNLHWHTLSMVSGGFDTLVAGANTIGEVAQKALYTMEDFERGKKNHFKKVLAVLANFYDQRTSKHFGAVDSWGPDKAIVIDGLTGLGNFVMHMITGNRPMRSQPDWGLGQDQLERTLRLLADGCKCHFVLLAHVEKEVDQLQGGTKITVSTLGKAFPPKVPPIFSDVILAVRSGTKWSWSTADAGADLKTRNLPVASDLQPSFKNIIEKWQSRGGKFTPTVQQ